MLWFTYTPCSIVLQKSTRFENHNHSLFKSFRDRGPRRTAAPSLALHNTSFMPILSPSLDFLLPHVTIFSVLCSVLPHSPNFSQICFDPFRTAGPCSQITLRIKTRRFFPTLQLPKTWTTSFIFLLSPTMKCRGWCHCLWLCVFVSVSKMSLDHLKDYNETQNVITGWTSTAHYLLKPAWFKMAAAANQC